jgi:hypothetical protein
MTRRALLLPFVAPLMLLTPGTPGAEELGENDRRLTELADVARQFPRHSGPTVIFVNFDGWKDFDGKGHDIQPFRDSDGRRGRDVQLILFRVAEVFAPFDVQVRRLRGSGQRDQRSRGNTTVFVGGNTAHVDGRGKKFTYAHTPARYDDYPGEVKGPKHRPNSDPFDLAFVDPVGQRGKEWVHAWDVSLIARAVTHEAGHTFGLAHTETSPVTEVMSYDAPNVYFANRAFRITDLNNTGTRLVHDPKHQVPRWGDRRVVTQNSYAYLRAVLGARAADDFASVADTGSVDSGFRDSPAGDLRPGVPLYGAVEHFGDYDVFVVRPESASRLAVRVETAAGSLLEPVLFVFDGAGRHLLGFANGKAIAGNPEVVIDVAAGRSYKVVVGAADGASGGAYRVTAGQVPRQDLAGDRPLPPRSPGASGSTRPPHPTSPPAD